MPPIKPSEVVDKKVVSIPEFVFDAFNELIVEGYNQRYSTVLQKDVVKLILDKMNSEGVDKEIWDNNWLNIKDAYIKDGWKVEYDKPGYNETYDASFKFTAPRMRDGTRGCDTFDYGTGK